MLSGGVERHGISEEFATGEAGGGRAGVGFWLEGVGEVFGQVERNDTRVLLLAVVHYLFY